MELERRRTYCSRSTREISILSRANDQSESESDAIEEERRCNWKNKDKRIAENCWNELKQVPEKTSISGNSGSLRFVKFHNRTRVFFNFLLGNVSFARRDSLTGLCAKRPKMYIQKGVRRVVTRVVKEQVSRSARDSRKSSVVVATNDFPAQTADGEAILGRTKGWAGGVGAGRTRADPGLRWGKTFNEISTVSVSSLSADSPRRCFNYTGTLSLVAHLPSVSSSALPPWIPASLSLSSPLFLDLCPPLSPPSLSLSHTPISSVCLSFCLVWLGNVEYTERPFSLSLSLSLSLWRTPRDL